MTAIAVAGVVLVVVVGAVLAGGRGDAPTPLDQARELTQDDDGFGSAREGAETLLEVSDLLAVEGEGCERRRKEERRDCRPYFAAAAFTRIAAVRVVECSRPELFDVRVGVDAFLDELRRSPTEAVVPAPPRCD